MSCLYLFIVVLQESLTTSKRENGGSSALRSDWCAKSQSSLHASAYGHATYTVHVRTKIKVIRPPYALCIFFNPGQVVKYVVHHVFQSID